MTSRTGTSSSTTRMRNAFAKTGSLAPMATYPCHSTDDHPRRMEQNLGLSGRHASRTLKKGGVPLLPNVLAERLLEISDKVIGVFDTDRQPDQIGRRRPTLAFARRAVFDQALDTSKRGRADEESGP